MVNFVKTLPLIIIYFVAVAQVGCRCICDSIDTLCLHSCVKTTHDCIADCQDATCYSECFEAYWPGIEAPEGSEETISTSEVISEDNHSSMVDQSITMASKTKEFATATTAQAIASELTLTVHTTVIRLTTITPIASTMPNTSSIFHPAEPSITSLGSKVIGKPVLSFVFASAAIAVTPLFFRILSFI